MVEFEVYFGDGTIGQSLADGNIVILEYIVTNTSRRKWRKFYIFSFWYLLMDLQTLVSQLSLQVLKVVR
jgi:hypothetical protein